MNSSSVSSPVSSSVQTLAQAPRLKGIIFDLDGTLVDSRLDFDLMRKELGIEREQGILEYLDTLIDGPDKEHCLEILIRHETKGAEEATLIHGVIDLLDKLSKHGLRKGILTRNISGPTKFVVDKFFGDHFCQIVTREDAAPKPAPEGLLKICRAWGCGPDEVVFIGDYRFDIEAGNNAKMPTILYLGSEEWPDYANQATYVVRCFEDFSRNFETIMSDRLGFARF